MRIIGLLSWYEEDGAWLAETVASAARLCDHVVAVDGPYATFPGALRKPASGSEQADVIARTAAGAGIGCTIHVPRQPWWGGEVEKRDWMFRAASLVAEPHRDWYLVIDADEVLTHVPPDARDLLAATDAHVAELSLWERDPSARSTGYDALCPERRLLRALPGLGVEQAHYVWTAPADGRKVVLRGDHAVHALAPAADLGGVRLEHRARQRPMARQQLKSDYYARVSDVERVAPMG